MCPTNEKKFAPTVVLASPKIAFEHHEAASLMNGGLF
jgi:hypothetical protein